MDGTGIDSESSPVFNPGQKRVLAEMSQNVLDMEVRLQAIDTFVRRLHDAPLMLQLAHVRMTIRKHFDILREGAHEYLLFLLVLEAPGAHHETIEVAFWLTPAKLSDLQIKMLVEEVLHGLADDDLCAISIRNGMGLVADGANANVRRLFDERSLV